jgi:hypothetical protein
MRKAVGIVVLVLLLGLAACGSNELPAGADLPGGEASQAAGEGDPSAGKDLLIQSSIGTQAGCTTCHSLEPGVIGLGPSLANTGAEAASRVAGMSAAEYLRESVLTPEAYIVAGFGGGVMPSTYGDELTEQQVTDLVAFLLTLK